MSNAALDKVGRSMTRNKTATEPQLRIGDHCHTKKQITDWCGQPDDRRRQLDWAVLIDSGPFGCPNPERYWVPAERVAPIAISPMARYFACFAYRK
jgi:hypothetical protein